MDSRASACPLDCPDACTLSVSVEAGRVHAITGDERNPLTGGHICGNVQRFPQRVHGPERILRPAFREGPKGTGGFQEVSWDEALSRVAKELGSVRERFGGEAILPLSYGGSNGLLTQDTVDARLFRRLGASRLARTVCAAPTGSAAQGLYGKMPGVSFADYRQARLIVVWGANPAHSGIHLLPPIREAQLAGARLVVIDPRRTPLARRADRHLPILPGTDVALALGMIHYLFETGRADWTFLEQHAEGVEALRGRASEWPFDRVAEVTGLDGDSVRALAEEYASMRPAVIRVGWGLERNRNGGSAAAAVMALPAVAGHFGRRGGGYTMSNGAVWKLSREGVIGAPEASTRLVNMNHLGRMLLEGEPPIRCLFVYNANPAVTLPDSNRVMQGLRRDDLFTVVFDQVWTDTAREADVVLPATTFLEHAELAAGYGVPALRSAEPVIAPVGEARSNVEVFADLCRRTGVFQPGDLEDPMAIRNAIIESAPDASRVAGELSAQGLAVPASGFDPVQFVDVSPRTPSGRIELCPAALDAEAPAGLYAFQELEPEAPLTLISPATVHSISSSLAELIETPARLRMHYDDATARGLSSGDAVRVFNRRGEVHCQLEVTSDVRSGVVVLPKGLWRRHTANGQTASALAPDTLTDLGGGACFNDARVEVEARPHTD